MKIKIHLDLAEPSVKSMTDCSTEPISGYSYFSITPTDVHKCFSIVIEGEHLKNIEDANTILTLFVKDHKEAEGEDAGGKIKNKTEERDSDGEIVKITTEYF
jgi:hypothetical protein